MIKFITTILAVSQLTGCAVYTVMNGATYIATDKSIADHATSKLASADCDAVRVIEKGTYYCEVRDISTTYNRTAF